jgi:DNA polymerase III delta prime subunit
MFLGNEHIKKVINHMFNTKRFDNIIIQGSESMGKSSFIKHILNEHIKTDYPYLYLHFLEDKGIDMIRNKIKYFTELKHDTTKFILIDDADDLSTSAQQSLRRIMEEKKKTSSFIFTVSNFKHLIFPIHSRCLLFQLRALSNNLKLEYLNQKYNNIYDKKFIKEISELYDYNIYSINKNINKHSTHNQDIDIIKIQNTQQSVEQEIQQLIDSLSNYNLTTIDDRIEEYFEQMKKYTKNKDPILYHYYYTIKPSLFNIIKPYLK